MGAIFRVRHPKKVSSAFAEGTGRVGAPLAQAWACIHTILTNVPAQLSPCGASRSFAYSRHNPLILPLLCVLPAALCPQPFGSVVKGPTDPGIGWRNMHAS